MGMNNTLSNGLLVLEHLAANAKSYSLSGLARELDLPKSHVHRLLQTLVESKYVIQDEKRQYRIGLGSLRVIRSLLMNIPLRIHGYQHLSHLAQNVQMTCTLAMPYGDDAISVAMYTHDGKIRDPIGSLGNILSAHKSASGKLFLAYRSDEELSDILARIDYSISGENTHTNADSLKTDLELIKQRDCSINDRENGPTTISIAVPIRDEDNRVYACVGAAAFADDFKEHKQQFVISELRQCAQHIESALKGVSDAHAHTR